MSESTNDWQQESLAAKDERSLVQKYLRNPLSVTWSKLAALFAPEVIVSESSDEELLDRDRRSQIELNPCDRNLYPRFTDRVDPSLYYTVFFPHQRY